MTITEAPQDLAAERALLGSMLVSVDAIADAIETLPPRGSDGVFYSPKHQAIFDAIIDMYTTGTAVDPVTVAAHLDRAGDLSRVGGAPYLHTLMTSSPAAASAGHYAAIVGDRCKSRRVLEAAVRVQAFAETGRDADELLNFAQEEMYRVGDHSGGQDVIHIGDYLEEAMERIDSIASLSPLLGMPTGIRDLDDLTNGLQPGQLVILAARPGVGKSTLGMDILRATAREGNACAFFSLEMSRFELTTRLLAAECRIHMRDLTKGSMDDSAWTSLGRTVGVLSEWPMFLDDSPNMTLVDIRAKARRLKQRHELKLIVVDYLQLMSSGKKVESRQQEVSEFSRQLKLLAKELEVPVVAISQLNRNAEQRADRTPQLADLRESGALEQDADIVVLIHRPDVVNGDDPRAGEADLIVAKHRGGRCGTVSVAHQLHYARFADLAKDV